MLHPGLYEQLINRRLRQELDNIPPERKSVAPVDPAEAAEVLSRYIAEAAKRALSGMAEGRGDVADQVALANRLIGLLPETDGQGIDGRAEQLMALLAEQDPALALGRTASDAMRPETSIAQSSLFTGAVHEPQMFSELKKEIASADRIDMLVSFIKWSGLRLILEDLEAFARRGGELRIITTSYMGATDVKAVEELAKLPNASIKVSYDTKRTRLHAKTYVFYRETGFTTAYVGSSNLSNAAISSGLEWNVKVTAKDLPATIRKIAATFDTYWHSDEFEFYSPDMRPRLVEALKAEHYDREHPLQSFEIYLRNCDLVGRLDLSGCGDLLFVDVYHNRLSAVDVSEAVSLRILGLQDNRIEALDVRDLHACQGIDAGMNRLSELDVSQNGELVELYINDNRLMAIDLSGCPKLKYFYCHNNGIEALDTRANPLLRHLNATGNPMKRILSLAPRRDESLPLELTAGEGGCVGLKFNPVYNAQWKETGEWQQTYYAYPDEGHRFMGWFDPEGHLLSMEEAWLDTYGTSRVLSARFE